MSRGFPGSGLNYLHCGTPYGVLDFGPSAPGQLTIAAWVYPLGYGTQTFIVGKAAASVTTVQYHLSLLSAGQGYFEFADGASVQGVQTTVGAPLNQWTHICACNVQGTNQMKAWFNGVLNNYTTRSKTMYDTSEPLLIGIRSNGQFTFSGYLAEIGIWINELSDVEVAELGKGVRPTSIRPQQLAAYWPLYGPGGTEMDYAMKIWNWGNELMPGGAVGTVYQNEAHPPITPFYIAA